MRAPRDPMIEPGRQPVAPPAWVPPDRASAGRGRGAGRSPASGRVLPFRRRKGLPVRRRSRLAAFVRPFLTALAIVGIPAALLWWSAASARFALTDLEVRGSERVSDAWLRAQLAPLVGRNLVWMPLGQVEQNLSGHPWVAGAEVTKELPDRLRVVVVERRPTAVLDSGEGLEWLSSEGEIIAPVLPGKERGVARGDELLRVRWEGAQEIPPERRRRTLAAAQGAARSLEDAAPDWGRAVTAVEVLGEEDFRLEGGALPFSLLVRHGRGDEEEIASRVRRLKNLRPELRTGAGSLPTPASVDLRFRHRIVVRPVVAEPPEHQERGP